jgi:hypothetical protein
MLKIKVAVVLMNVKNIKEPLANYQLLPCWLTALINDFRNFCFIFKYIKKNCQRLSHKAFQSYGPIGTRIQVKKIRKNVLCACKKATYISNKLNFCNMF